MFNRLMKVTGSTGEQRWINLDRITRVSLAKDTSGDEMLVFCFDGQDQVKIHGNDAASRELIARIKTSLNAAAETPCRCRAA